MSNSKPERRYSDTNDSLLIVTARGWVDVGQLIRNAQWTEAAITSAAKALRAEEAKVADLYEEYMTMEQLIGQAEQQLKEEGIYESLMEQLAWCFTKIWHYMQRVAQQARELKELLQQLLCLKDTMRAEFEKRHITLPKDF